MRSIPSTLTGLEGAALARCTCKANLGEADRFASRPPNKKAAPDFRDRLTAKLNLEHDLRLNLTLASGRQTLSK
jgi:hypothetical protein